jgi:MFS family permease
MCNGFIQNFAGLCVCRLILGFFEGCLFPCLTLFFANWYKREELAQRVSYLFSESSSQITTLTPRTDDTIVASALSGAFGGLIAFAILYMDGVAGYPGWRWLYILEGLITLVWAGCCIYLVPKDYQTAYFLNAEDKKIMAWRAEQSRAYSGGTGHYGKKHFKAGAGDIKTWLHAVTQIMVVTILYGFGTFLPVILRNGFNFTLKQSQYLVIPVNLWGAIVYAIGAYISDKKNARFWVLVTMAPVGMAGYAILLAWNVPVGVQYFATYLIATACFICTGGNIAWLSGNCAPDGKRAVSLGIQLTLTNLGGIVSGQIYQTKSAPEFKMGHGWSLACLGYAFCSWWIIRWIYLRREADKDRRLAEGWTPEEDERAEREGGIGFTDRSPNFRYQL